MLDSYQREINYVRLSVTDLCNQRCLYCTPFGVPKCKHEDVLRIESYTKIVKALSDLGIEKVRLTGGEPLLKKGLNELIKQIRPMVRKITMTTNGALLSSMAQNLKNCGLDGINISLDTLDDKIYNKITGGGILKNTLLGADAAFKAGFELKFNAVLQKGINDESLPSLAKYANERNAVFRFIELMPFKSTENYFNEKYMSVEEIIVRYGLKYLYHENNCSYFDFSGIKIGLISAVSNKFCSHCNRIRVNGKGILIPCLHSNFGYDLKPYLNNEEKLKEFLAVCIKKKPLSHNLNKGVRQSTDMYKIGG